MAFFKYVSGDFQYVIIFKRIKNYGTADLTLRYIIK
jgi:hypothetical protein